MASNPGYGDDDLVSIAEAAKIADVHPNTLRRWSDTGLIPLYRTPSNRRRFKVADLRNIIRRDDSAASAS